MKQPPTARRWRSMPSWRPRVAGSGTLFTATVSVVAACATVVPGTPVGADAGPQMVVDPTLLDTGTYPTKPRPALGIAGTPLKGAIVEAQRMANYVVGPWEVDPALKARHPIGAFVLDSTEAYR